MKSPLLLFYLLEIMIISKYSGFITKSIINSKISHSLFKYGNSNFIKTKLHSSAASPPAPTLPTVDEKKLKEFRILVQDIIKLALNTGVKMGITRTIQLTKASILLTKDIAKNPSKYQNPETKMISFPKLFRNLFERLGATYVKLGQFIASSPTLFPAEFVLEFQACLDSTPTIPYTEVKSIIESELKRPISEVYSYVNPVAIASASIAQVHQATLKNGTQVCIKVQKPGADVTLIADLNFLTVCSKIIEFINPTLSRISLSNIVEDIKNSMFEELDFVKEGKNLINFRAFLERNNIVDAVAPMPYMGLTTKRILTMEFLKGVPLVDLNGIKQYTDNPEMVLLSALRTWALSVTENDVFHADVHGGNLLVLEDGRVGFIDFGIVGRIPDKVWLGLNSMIQGLVESNFKQVAESLVSMGATSADVNIDKFADEVKNVFQKISTFQPELLVVQDSRTSSVSAQLNVDEKETTEFVLELVEVANKNGLKLPREFGFLLKQALYFDRYQKLLAPNVDPLRDSRLQESFAMTGMPTKRYGAGNSDSKRAVIDTDIV